MATVHTEKSNPMFGVGTAQLSERPSELYYFRFRKTVAAETGNRAPSCFRCRSMSVALVRYCFELGDVENVIWFAFGIEILTVTGPKL